MSVDLETLALIAAAVHKPLRASLDANDFHLSKNHLVEAFKDIKRPENRQAIKEWMATLGVDLDGQTDIGVAILSTLRGAKQRKRTQTALELALSKLRYPHLAGPQGTVEATKLAESIQEIMRGKFQ
jgi:hypothetical protein